MSLVGRSGCLMLSHHSLALSLIILFDRCKDASEGIPTTGMLVVVLIDFLRLSVSHSVIQPVSQSVSQSISHAKDEF